MFDKLASVLAHEALAKAIDADAAPLCDEVTATARCQERGLQCIVIFAPCDCGDEPARVDSEIKPLREVEQNIIAAATITPIGVKKLATLAGYGYSSYFRAAVSILIERGLLRRVRGGVRLP